MPSLNFPDSPTNGQVFVSGSRKWTYDSATNRWVSSNTTLVGATGLTGATGPFVTNIPPSSNVTVVSADAGKYLNVNANVTFNASTSFSSGDAVTIYNNSNASITVVSSSITLRLAGTATTGNRALAQRGVATVLCVASNDYVISGAGLS